jgi:hypothetical protein
MGVGANAASFSTNNKTFWGDQENILQKGISTQEA